MNLSAGFGGAARHACVTLCADHQILGICEQERITRVRAAGFNPTGIPDEALDELLRRSGRQRGDVSTYAVAETSPITTRSIPAVTFTRLDHHFTHASSAFLPSPFEHATIVVCDHESPRVSVWDGCGNSVTPVDWPWTGPGFADVYSQCAEALGFRSVGREQRLEAFARLEPSHRDARVDALFRFDVDRLELAVGWQDRIRNWIGADAPLEKAYQMAAALQARIGDLLVEFVAEVKGRAPARHQLCVAGSLFHNSYFNARLKCCNRFDGVFVPINPGNAGLAIGAALHVSGHPRQPVTPFLGPSYRSDEIKTTLDNCKLSYEWVSKGDATAIAVDELRKGHLVAWFEGRMEWGHRALGARSILASPFAPYVLDNLNQFLKHRDVWRGYALSSLDTATREHFEGPSESPFMECDYAPKDRERFRHVLPGPNANLRVHTVGGSTLPGFRGLLEAFGAATGIPVVVNTSFNGFSEPIVCSPRDAVRVFFGTGIDVLILDQFVIRK